MIDDADIEDEENENAENLKPQRKRIMLLLLPLVVIIGITVGAYFAMNASYDSLSANYNIIKYSDSSEDVTAFYDLPEVKYTIKGSDGPHELRLKVTLEVSSIDNLNVIEVLTPKLNDVILSHIVELRFEELLGSTGLYWLKEELLYRFNLVSAPVKIKNINFSVFELQ